MYSQGVSIQGVGNRAAHNLIHNAPHNAIIFGGNDHVIEFNEIHDVVLESDDQGGVDMFGDGKHWFPFTKEATAHAESTTVPEMFGPRYQEPT